MKEKITVLVPVYRGSHILPRALDSIYNQTYTNFEVIVGDDNHPSEVEEIKKTQHICKKYTHLTYIKNKKNLGCQQNFQVLVDHTRTNLLIFLAQDDIFSKDALEKVVKAFNEYPEAAFLTRPYFWFEEDIQKPIRHVPPLNTKKNMLMHIEDGAGTVKGLFSSVGQISGLALKKKLIRIPFHPDIFPGHIYPIADLFKDYPGIFLKDYIVAVGVYDSQSRNISSIYDDSPTEQWMKMFNTIYAGKQYESFRKECISFMATNFEGLTQLKNYANPGVLPHEIMVLLKYRPLNIVYPKFWLYVLISLLTPRTVLRRLTDWYKRNIVAKSIPPIDFRIE